MRFGIPPATARQQLSKQQQSAQQPEPLPAPTGAAPFRLPSSSLGLEQATSRRLFVIGDHGGVKDPAPQLAVANAMVASSTPPELCYSVGDVVYFNGAQAEYGPQFYEPYAHCNWPFVAIPGNHDGDPEEDGEPSLTAFTSNFCAASPALDPTQEEYERDTMIQPNVYWTLDDSAVTIIGLYTNVPSGGYVAPDQQEWFEGELRAAPTDRPVIVTLHHPPLSADAHHGGSRSMLDLLDNAFQAAGRWPALVIAGHVHDYQRFTRQVDGRQLTYLVNGAGGYHNLHAMAPDATRGMGLGEGVTLDAFEASMWGFLILQVDPGKIAGEYVGVEHDGTIRRGVDSFTVGT